MSHKTEIYHQEDLGLGLKPNDPGVRAPIMNLPMDLRHDESRHLPAALMPTS